MPTRLKALPLWLRALALLLALALPLNAAELNNSGSGQWSETDSSNTSASPDGWPVGLAPNQVRGVGQAMMGAIKRAWDRSNCTVTSGGSSNAYTYTPTNASFPTAIVTGEAFCFKANFTNTSAATLAINGLTAKNIYKQGVSGPTALTGGEIQSGQLVKVAYDGTQYQIITQIPYVGPTVLKKGANVTAPTDISENTLATINIPANIGANAKIRYEFDFAVASNANGKTMKLKIGGSNIVNQDLANTANWRFVGTLTNLNATNSQWASTLIINSSVTPTSAALGATAAIDTTSATTMVITMQKGTGSDSVILKSYLFEIISDGN